MNQRFQLLLEQKYGKNLVKTYCYFIHLFLFLGVAKSLKHLRQIMEQRCEVEGRALRIEKAKYCRREGKSSLGCPIAKYVIRR